ncbi:MAG: carbohydrate ABC transporter permease [Caldicoprobacter sp.]|uniref:carbohydrate ABC transporter permease n=1 Tax=Caldicoprobacter sp. TaxID=2004500 RepID=UPI0039C1A6C5
MKKSRINWSNIAYHVLMVLFSFLMLYPVLWMIFSSFKENERIFATAHILIPEKWIIENYIEGWKGFGGTSFDVFFKNSLFYSGVGTIGTVISSLMVAYGFSRVNFKGRNFWFACMMMTMMLPAQVVIIPQFIMFHKFNWVNSFKPLIVPTFTAGPFFVFLIMQFIRGIPSELDEAAKIDGCNKYEIFFRIIVPLVKPAIITTTIFSFYWKWDDFLGPLLYLNKPKLYTVSLALRAFNDATTKTNWGGLLAMSTLSLVPVLIIFFAFQRYLVEGIATTGLKG